MHHDQLLGEARYQVLGLEQRVGVALDHRLEVLVLESGLQGGAEGEKAAAHAAGRAVVEQKQAWGLGRGAGEGLGGGAGGAEAVEEQGEALEDGNGEQDLGKCEEV